MSWIAAVFAALEITLGVYSLFSNINGAGGCADCTTDVGSYTTTTSVYISCSAWASDETKCLDSHGLFLALLVTAIIILVSIVELAIAIATASVACCCSSPKKNRVGSVYDMHDQTVSPYPPQALQPQQQQHPPSYPPSEGTPNQAPSTHTLPKKEVSEISYADRYNTKPPDLPAYTWSPNY